MWSILKFYYYYYYTYTALLCLSSLKIFSSHPLRLFFIICTKISVFFFFSIWNKLRIEFYILPFILEVVLFVYSYFLFLNPSYRETSKSLLPAFTRKMNSICAYVLILFLYHFLSLSISHTHSYIHSLILSLFSPSLSLSNLNFLSQIHNRKKTMSSKTTKGFSRKRL